MLSELYIAESKTQVYGALHDYLRRNSSLLTELSEYTGSLIYMPMP